MAERAAIELDRDKVRFTNEGLEVNDPAAGDLSRLGRNGTLELMGLGHFPTRFAPVERIEGRLLVMKQPGWANNIWRSEEHTSELQSLMRISYAVFCLTNTKSRTAR